MDSTRLRDNQSSNINPSAQTTRFGDPRCNPEEVATEVTHLLSPSSCAPFGNYAEENNMNRTYSEESLTYSEGSVPPQNEEDRIQTALVQEEEDIEGEYNSAEATDTNRSVTNAGMTNTGPTTEEDFQDSITNLTNRLRCLFACLTLPVFPLGLLLAILLLRLLYCAFVKDISHSCTHPLKLYAILSFSLFFYVPQHKRVKMCLFGYHRDRDGGPRPRAVRIYDQCFHLVVLWYIYFGMLLVQGCKDDTIAGRDDQQTISTCAESCPSTYSTTRIYVLIMKLLVIVFLLPLVCLPFIYLWIIRRVTTEEAWARFGRAATGEDDEDETNVTTKEILEQMNEVLLIKMKGKEGQIKVVHPPRGCNGNLEEGAVNGVEHQLLEWEAVKDCCICMSEFHISDNETHFTQIDSGVLDINTGLNFSTDPDNSSSSRIPQANHDLLKEENIIIQTKCGHLFHKVCISGWIHGQWGEESIRNRQNGRARRRACPLCRQDLAPFTLCSEASQHPTASP